ncbi:MAG: Arc family DNA-binding protein [Paracoccus sp. (in: a-proteobacteria)]|nr:Arc family DNA-binding protein [Paracoccus sp. (in: a-proteobacteria)]
MNYYPSTLADRFIIRLPVGWRDAIKAEAAKNHRSMNAEILADIETAMRIKGVSLDAEV